MASKCDEGKISFTNQVVKDNFVFPLFWSNLMIFSFKLGILFSIVYEKKDVHYYKPFYNCVDISWSFPKCCLRYPVDEANYERRGDCSFRRPRGNSAI